MLSRNPNHNQPFCFNTSNPKIRENGGNSTFACVYLKRHSQTRKFIFFGNSSTLKPEILSSLHTYILPVVYLRNCLIRIHVLMTKNKFGRKKQCKIALYSESRANKHNTK